jgi:hypothetical protein
MFFIYLDGVNLLRGISSHQKLAKEIMAMIEAMMTLPVR